MTRRLSKSWSFLFATLLLPLVLALAVQPAFAQPAPMERPASSAAEEPGNLLDRLQPPGAMGGFQDPGSAGGFGDFGLGDTFADREVTLSAAFTTATEGQPARLFVTAEMAPGWHVYSITQPAGAVKPTIVKLEASKGYAVQGEFVPDRAPEVRKTEVFPVPLEEHYSVVTFSAPIQIASGEDAGQLRIAGELEGMVCHDERGCVPLSLVDTKFVARLATGQAARDLLAKVPSDADASPADDATQPKPDSTVPSFAVDPRPAQAEEGYRADGTHVAIRGRIEPETVVPGATATLFLTALSDPDWHVYAYADKSVPGDISCPTRLVLQQPPGWTLGPVQASSPPTEKQEGEFPVVRYHEGSVTWKAEIHVPHDVPPGQYTLNGLIGYQTCSTVCERPTAAAFSTTLRVGPQPVPGQHELAFTTTKERYREVASLADETQRQVSSTDRDATESDAANVVETGAGSRDVGPDAADSDMAAVASAADQDTATAGAAPKFDAANVETTEVVEATSLGKAILFALAGGLILNIMPCVLPVIGLKILSFFDQAGKSRSRAFWLNVWYSLGLLSVFIVLAALGIGLSGLFTKNVFAIVMVAVVFAMALSLMGLWELRMPSFLGGAGAQKLTQQEGAVGAFFKGTITTLLAIPCGAPLLSPALKWADEQVRLGAPQNVYLVFAMIGVGMATPYLVIGAYPELLRFLPKPGAWMETFKKAMGYFLLLAVVWILYFVPREEVVATVALLFAIWFACWMVGRLPITARGEAKAWSWAGGLAVIGLTYVIGFHVLLRPAAVKQLKQDAAKSIYAGDFDDEVKQRFVQVQIDEAAHLASATPQARSTQPRDEVAVTTPPKVMPVAVETGESESSEDTEKSELPWQPFGRARFEALVTKRNTILVDFTADWCLTCKALEASVLNTRPIREFVDRNGVITMKADYTRGDKEITEMLEILGSRQVPVIAIFPAGNPNKPIVLRGWYNHKSLLDALEQAGPSAGYAEKRRTAMRVP